MPTMEPLVQNSDEKTRGVSRRQFLRNAAGVAAALTAGPLVASACGGGNSTPSSANPATAKIRGTVKMTFLEFFTGALWGPLFEPLVHDFEAKNPHIKWEGIPVAYNNLEQKFLTMAAGGTPPDGLSLDNTELPSVAARGMLQDLAPYIKAHNYDLSVFFPARLANGQWLGKQYGMPIDMGSSAIWYNKDAFDQAGVAYPKSNWTWDDLRAMALKLTLDHNGKRPGESGFDPTRIKQYGFKFDFSTYRFYYAYTGYNGAQYFNKPVSSVELGDAKSITSLNFFNDLVKSHVSPLASVTNGATNNGTIHLFPTGLYAMDFAWIGECAYLHQPGVKVHNYDVQVLPQTQYSKTEVGGQTFVITKGAKQPEAAWDWIDYMTDEHAQKALGANGSWFSGQKRYAKYSWPTDRQPAHFIEVFYDQIAKNGLSEWWFTQDWPQWQTSMDSNLVALFSEQRSPQAAAANIKQTIGSQVQSWRSSTHS